MTKKTILLQAALFVLTSFVCGSSLADIRDQLDVQTGKAELVIPNMSAPVVAAQVKDAISSWSIPANANVRSMPSKIPARPDEPVSVQRYFNGAPAIEYQCSTAYAEVVKRPPPVKNAFMYASEFLQACIYPFEKGTKVYLLFTSIKKTESLTSGLFNGITRAIRGEDGDWMTKQISENVASIKKNIPSLLVEKIEVPGKDLHEPDKTAVALLIPPASPVQPIAPVVAPVAAQSAPVQQAISPTVTTSSMGAKIEARKNLNAMGMLYHSAEQFVAAIRRKDDVAVQLFLDAGGIDLETKDKSNKSYLDIAKEAGGPVITKLISDKLAKPDAPAASAPVTVPTPVAAQPAAADSGKRHAANIAAASLPPELLAQINAQIDSMDIPTEQREEMRATAILNVSETVTQFKTLADRIDPETGRLR